MIGRRQAEGTNIAGTVQQHGSKVGHLFKSSIRDITLEREFGYGLGMRFAFDMELTASSPGSQLTAELWADNIRVREDTSNKLQFLNLSSYIYWTEEDTIRRANKDGSDVETLASGVADPRGIALDRVGGKMYWAERDSGLIRRANKDGSDIETLVSGIDLPQGIALDINGRKMYWSVEGVISTGEIQRANLDGSDVETLVANISEAHGLALDLVRDKVYWLRVKEAFLEDYTEKIQRANLDGSNVETLVAIDLPMSSPSGIALDVEGQKIYWTDAGTGVIQRANLNGTNIETIVANLDSPWDIALDVTNGKMYWADTFNIGKANFDGTGMETLISELSRPSGLTLIEQTIGSDRLFPGPLNFSVGDRPLSVAVGDLNSDGVLDLVTSNFGFTADSADLSVLPLYRTKK
jgi:DNA-binding beta-propeller fold protein YncE